MIEGALSELPAISAEIFWICPCTARNWFNLSSFLKRISRSAGVIESSCSFSVPGLFSGCTVSNLISLKSTLVHNFLLKHTHSSLSHIKELRYSCKVVLLAKAYFSTATNLFSSTFFTTNTSYRRLCQL